MERQLPLLHGDKDGNLRIMIWGNSGSGKTTLSHQLSRVLGEDKVRPIDMDALFWNDDWVATPRPQLRELIDSATSAAPSWVTDGAYTSHADVFYPKATDIVWLDYPLHVTFLRVLRRTVARWWTGERLFGTNCQEDWRKTLFSRESILWWCVSMHWEMRRRFEGIMGASPELPLRRRFTRPADVDAWVATLEAAVAAGRKAA